MATLRELMTATDAELVRHFYRLDLGVDADFIKRINLAAAGLGLNHSQLICALGLNAEMCEMPDILTELGFSSYKLLAYRRNELFINDPYGQLSPADIETVYGAPIEDAAMARTRHELMLARLLRLEQQIERDDDAALVAVYKREVAAIYAGAAGTVDFVMQRVTTAIGDKRVLIDEIELIVASAVLPIPNLFFSDFLLPVEKRYLLERGDIAQPMIENRLQNSDISEDERQMLENFLK